MAESLSVELLKIQRVFDVRWVFQRLLPLRLFCVIILHFLPTLLNVLVWKLVVGHPKKGVSTKVF